MQSDLLRPQEEEGGAPTRPGGGAASESGAASLGPWDFVAFPQETQAFHFLKGLCVLLFSWSEQVTLLQ